MYCYFLVKIYTNAKQNHFDSIGLFDTFALAKSIQNPRQSRAQHSGRLPHLSAEPRPGRPPLDRTPTNSIQLYVDLFSTSLCRMALSRDNKLL